MQIRIFDDLAKTVEYARMVEASGASLLAVHGRTREQKQAKLVRANWDYIKVLPCTSRALLQALAAARAAALMVPLEVCSLPTGGCIAAADFLPRLVHMLSQVMHSTSWHHEHIVACTFTQWPCCLRHMSSAPFFS